MKKIRLIELNIKNFKGIKNTTLKPDGLNAQMFGKNETKKTTHFDAFLWLMFGKNSQNQTDFEIKGLDKDGNVKQHGLDHEVSGVISVDGQEVELKRVYREVWTKPRQKSSKVLTSHTTDYWINGVPGVKAGEYKEFINNIIDEKTFRLLTDVRFFNEHLEWPARRDILLTAFPDATITDKEVVDATFPSVGDKKKHMNICNILNGHGVDDSRKIARARQTKIIEEKDGIGTRIDEKKVGLPDVSDLSKKGINETVNRLTEEIGGKLSEIQKIKTGGLIPVKQNRIEELKGTILKKNNLAAEESSLLIGTENKALDEVLEQYNELDREKSQLSSAIFNNLKTVADYEGQMDRLRIEYKEQFGSKFDVLDAGGLSRCEKCGHVTGAKKAEASFNSNKAANLEAIDKKGFDYKDAVESLAKENSRSQERLDLVKTDLKKLDKQITGLKNKIKNLKENTEIIVYVEKEKLEIDTLNTEIEELRTGSASEATKLAVEIGKLEIQKKENESYLADFTKNEEADTRIKELEAMEVELATEYEKLEAELNLISTFIQARANLLEGKIRNKFRITRFKMFSVQVNGDIDDRMCEAMVDGIPYTKNLNNGNRIKCGIDVIATLSEAYQVSVPLWIDNAEAVTDLFPIDSQTIELYVSQKHKKLKVVIEKPEGME